MCLPLVVPPLEGLYFTLSGTIYLSGATIPITDVGISDGQDAGSSLVCRINDVGRGIILGAWYFPNGTKVPDSSLSTNSDFITTTNEKQMSIRLNRRSGVSSPIGNYNCIVKFINGESLEALITLTGN